jgi:hypothetical protein
MSAVVYSGTFTPFGPIIPFHVGPSATRKTLLQARGIPIPEPQPIKAVIDTGASHSVICRGLLQDEIYGPALAHGGGLDFLGRSYDVAYRRVSCHFAEFQTELVVGEWPLYDERLEVYQCCIGRDLLGLSDFILDGEAQMWTLVLYPAKLAAVADQNTRLLRGSPSAP